MSGGIIDTRHAVLAGLAGAAGLLLACGGGAPSTTTYAEQRAVGMHEMIIEAHPKGTLSEDVIQRVLENIEVMPAPNRRGFRLVLTREELGEAYRLFLTPPMMQTHGVSIPPDCTDPIPMLEIEVWLRPGERHSIRVDGMKDPMPPVHQMIQIWRLPGMVGPYEIIDPFEAGPPTLDIGRMGHEPGEA